MAGKASSIQATANVLAGADVHKAVRTMANPVVPMARKAIRNVAAGATTKSFLGLTRRPIPFR